MSDDAKILATIPRNATEQLQISINSYKEKKYLDLRIYYTTDDGESWLPTKKGVTVSPDSLQILKDSVEKAMEELLDSEE